MTRHVVLSALAISGESPQCFVGIDGIVILLVVSFMNMKHLFVDDTFL